MFARPGKDDKVRTGIKGYFDTEKASNRKMESKAVNGKSKL